MAFGCIEQHQRRRSGWILLLFQGWCPPNSGSTTRRCHLMHHVAAGRPPRRRKPLEPLVLLFFIRSFLFANDTISPSKRKSQIRGWIQGNHTHINISSPSFVAEWGFFPFGRGAMSVIRCKSRTQASTLSHTFVCSMRLAAPLTPGRESGKRKFYTTGCRTHPMDVDK